MESANHEMPQQQEPIQQVVSEVQGLSNEKKSNPFGKIFFFLLMFLIALGIGGEVYYFASSNKLSLITALFPAKPQVTIVPLPSPTPVASTSAMPVDSSSAK